MQLSPTFKHTLVVDETDIDMLGHASNLAFVRWIQDVAVAHSQSVGFGLDAYQKLGGVFVVVRHEIDYLRPALRGDEVEARTWISSVQAAKCHRTTEIGRGEQLLAKSVTTWGYVEVMTGRPRRIPQELREAFLGAKG